MTLMGTTYAADIAWVEDRLAHSLNCAGTRYRFYTLHEQLWVQVHGNQQVAHHWHVLVGGYAMPSYTDSRGVWRQMILGPRVHVEVINDPRERTTTTSGVVPMPEPGVHSHSYTAYKAGHRDAGCKAANAAYMRRRRAAAAAARHASAHPALYTVAGIKHGYSGYQNFSCRCEVCRKAKRAAERKARARTEIGSLHPGINRGLAIIVTGVGLFLWGWSNSSRTPDGRWLLAVAIVGVAVLVLATGVVKYRRRERLDAAHTSRMEAGLRQDTSGDHYLDGA